MNTTTTQAQIFRTRQAENAAAEMIEVVDVIRKRSKRIAQIALGVSMPHQIGYLISLAIPHMHGGATGMLDALGMILLAIAVPIVSDLLILTCIDTIGAAAAARTSKIRAFCLMLAPIGVSGVVNFLAPAPPVIKALAAFMVLSIPIAVALKFVRVDFDKLEAIENTLTAAAPAVDQAEIARRKEIASRAVATRKANAAKLAQDTADALAADQAKKAARNAAARQRRAVQAAIPVSPAHIVGPVTGLHIPTKREVAALVA